MQDALHPPPPRIPAHYQFKDAEGNHSSATLVTFTLPRVGELLRYGERVFKVVRVFHNAHVLRGYSEYPILTPTVVCFWDDPLNQDAEFSQKDMEAVEEMLRQIEDPQA